MGVPSIAQLSHWSGLGDEVKPSFLYIPTSREVISERMILIY